MQSCFWWDCQRHSWLPFSFLLKYSVSSFLSQPNSCCANHANLAEAISSLRKSRILVASKYIQRKEVARKEVARKFIKIKEELMIPADNTVSQFSWRLWIPLSVCFLQSSHSTYSSQLKTWWHFLLSLYRFLWTLLNRRWRMRKFLCIHVQLEPAEKQRCPLLCTSRQLHRLLLWSPGFVCAQCKHVPYQSRARVKQRFPHSVLHWFFCTFLSTVLSTTALATAKFYCSTSNTTCWQCQGQVLAME